MNAYFKSKAGARGTKLWLSKDKPLVETKEIKVDDLLIEQAGPQFKLYLDSVCGNLLQVSVPNAVFVFDLEA